MLVHIKAVTAVHILVRQIGRDIERYQMLPLHQKDDGWTFAQQTVTCCYQGDFKCRYRYHVIIRSSLWSSSEDFYDREKDLIPVSDVYDVFDLTSRRAEIKDDIITGKLIHIGMIFNSVSTKTLKQSIICMEENKLPEINTDFKKIRKLIESKAASLDSSASAKAQNTFLIIILKKVLNSTKKPMASEFCISGDSIYYLINTLKSLKKEELSSTVLCEDLKCVCVLLIRSANYNWLHMWKLFYHILGEEVIKELEKNHIINSPKLTESEWQSSEKSLIQEIIDMLDDNKEAIQILITALIGSAKDTFVLNELLSLFKQTAVVDSREVNNKASSKLTELIKNTKLSKNIDRLAEVWQSTMEINTNVAESARTVIIEYLQNETLHSSDPTSKVIHTILLKKEIYSSAEDFTGVMEHLIKEVDDWDVYEIFLEVLQRDDLMAFLETPTIKELLTRAIKLCLPHRPITFTTTDEEKIKSVRCVYRLIAVTSRCDHFNEECLNEVRNRAFKASSRVSLDILLKLISLEICNDPRAQGIDLNCLAEHIQRHLRNRRDKKSKSVMDYVSYLKSSEGDQLIVDTKHIRGIILAMLDTLDTPPSTKEVGNCIAKLESEILEVLKIASFWLGIFQSTGRYSDNLKEHKCSQAVASLLKLEGQNDK